MLMHMFLCLMPPPVVIRWVMGWGGFLSLFLVLLCIDCHSVSPEMSHKALIGILPTGNNCSQMSLPPMGACCNFSTIPSVHLITTYSE